MAEVASFELESIYYVVLFAVAIFAGFIDSIVGLSPCLR